VKIKSQVPNAAHAIMINIKGNPGTRIPKSGSTRLQIAQMATSSSPVLIIASTSLVIVSLSFIIS
jgi:hypothetical protein